MKRSMIVDGPAPIFDFAPDGVKVGTLHLLDQRPYPVKVLLKVRDRFNALVVFHGSACAFQFRARGARFEYRPISKPIDPAIWAQVRSNIQQAMSKD